MIPPIVRPPEAASAYRNPRVLLAESDWDIRRVLGQWVRLNRRDSAWTPPHIPQLRQLLTRNAYFRKSIALLLSVEALSPGDALEVPVATALVRVLPTRSDTAFLSLFYCVNNQDMLETVISSFYEQLPALGIRRLVGPLTFSPYLPGGALLSHWQRLPAGLPYYPPYMPELLGSFMHLKNKGFLYHLQDAPKCSTRLAGLVIKPLTLQALAENLDVVKAAWTADFLPELTTQELTVVPQLLKPLRPVCYSAWLAGQLVGILLINRDTSSALRQTAGARGLPGLFYPWLAQRTNRAHVTLLAVKPELRRQGIASRLLDFAWHTLKQQGLVSFSIGPVIQGVAVAFLDALGATSREAFGVYFLDL